MMRKKFGGLGQKRWQDAINRVSLNLQTTRKSSMSTRGGSFHSDSEVDDGPKGPAVLYENTFQLEPKDNQKFPTKKAEDVIKAIFNSNLRDKKYISDSSRNLTTNLSELIRTQVKQELGKQNRFKIVVMVLIGSMEGQGVRCASRCLWYPQCDRFATYHYNNEHLFAVGTVYGVYYE
ncbi:dynein light chain Tctex-type 5-B-like [Bolinopsis microptera]|uniref:dynein light chain Tctex-type 5-B-like n=1 Tax=Bolinopsis microptera TaxID=2820187 RepID=UPI00307AB11E